MAGAQLYAGVWVPERRKKQQWAVAMDRLRGVAGVDSLVDQLAGLRASA